MANRSDKPALSTSLYISDADPYAQHPLSAISLRAKLVYRCLFFDTALIGDTWFNCNPALRALLYPGEQTQLSVPTSLRDLGRLVTNGNIVPIIRDGCSLGELAREHTQRGIRNVPSQEYTEYVEGLLATAPPSYSPDVVASMFKSRLFDAFSPDSKNTGPGKLSKDIAMRVLEHLESQTVHSFRAIRSWLNGELERGTLSLRQHSMIDAIVARSYRHNIGLSLDSNIDVSPEDAPAIFPIETIVSDRRTANVAKMRSAYIHELEFAPTLFLSQSVLAHIPAEILLTIKGALDGTVKPLESYKRVIGSLQQFREGSAINIDDFVNHLAIYLTEVDDLLSGGLPAPSRTLYQKAKREAKRGTILRIVTDGIVALLGLVPYAGSIINITHCGYNSWQNLKSATFEAHLAKAYVAGRQSSITPLFNITYPPDE